MSEAGSEGKSFVIPKSLVWRAWQKVKANKGAAGVDEQTIAEFERDEKGNLYRIWNRLSSGTWFPPPVKAVEIPKADGGVRVLGVPTLADRIAQTVVAMELEPEAEKVFHPDSYGYRPGRSAHDAVAACRQRCWRTPWVVDLDIRAFFDSVPHDLIIKAVQRHTTKRWVLLYVRRWLKAPLQTPDGQLQQRDLGTPQGSAISPLLANLFLHYAFDAWMVRTFPQVEFERYCDDAVLHCVSEEQANTVRDAVADRFGEVGLELHPDKTKIVYCPQDGRPRERNDDIVQFTFLGFTFARRKVKDRHGRIKLGFVPMISKAAVKSIGRVIRSWSLGRRTDLDLHQIARYINPIVAGWISYYGRFYKSKVVALLRRINRYLVKWARRKYKRLRYRPREARKRLARLARNYPGYFAHWRHGAKPLHLATGAV